MQLIKTMFLESIKIMETNSIYSHNEVHWCQFDNPVLQSIPSEIWNKIFRNLPDIDLGSLEMSCRTFRILLSDYPFVRMGYTGYVAKHGKYELLTTSKDHFNIILQTRNEITLAVNGRLRKISRKAGVEGTKIEEVDRFFLPERELRMHNHSVYIGYTGSFCHRRDKPLDTMKQIPPVGKQLFVASANKIRFVWKNSENNTIGVKQYALGTYQTLLSYFVGGEGNEFYEEWNVQCGQLPHITHIWSSDDNELYCSTPSKVFRIQCEPAGLHECNIPQYTGTIKSVEAVGDRLLLLLDTDLLICLRRSAENVNQFIMDFSQKVGEFDQIKCVTLRNENLCIEFSTSKGWVHHDGWGEDDGYEDIRETLVILNSINGEILYNRELGFSENWDVLGSILLTFDRITNNKSFTVRHLRKRESFYQYRGIPIGCIWSAKINPETGAILLDIEHNGVHSLYELNSR